ncbi:hypothetical protein [Asticcacaulis sp.]|uniref:hypothetical protein n=1 Tax=Asticcacaulis sp. TaxID=1872648 RepID=UPI002602D63D|nr:hypothetical protein [Asticcacaulis sp.]
MIDDEIENNFRSFFERWSSSLSGNSAKSVENPLMLQSYKRMLSVQVIRSTVVYKECSPECGEFFLEAQNDILVSHISAAQGSWRAALQAMRSFLENSLCVLYYMDHKVELRQWQVGQFKIGFSDLCKYILLHPDYEPYERKFSCVSNLAKEYATLSKAVHGSSKNFRMAREAEQLAIFPSDKSSLSQWSTRERAVIGNVVLVYLVFFKNYFQGASNISSRSVMGYCFEKRKKEEIRKELSINLS